MLLCLIGDKAAPSTLCSTDVARASFRVYILTIKRVDSDDILTLENCEVLVFSAFGNVVQCICGSPHTEIEKNTRVSVSSHPKALIECLHEIPFM